jgi:alcohol dehydrogenase class IV
MTIQIPPLPVVAMPTTAGTGSEATKNAVISSHDPAFKKSLRSEMMLPRIVLIDPELATTCPRAVTAHSGMDAITQCFESFISRKAKPIARTLAADGFCRGMRFLAAACEDASSRRAREAMAHAALLSGLALANSGLGLAHGVAAALGVRLNVPHGLACAVMLRAALHTNRSCCENDYAELELRIGSTPAPASELADRLVARISALCDRLKVPERLTSLGVTRELIPELAEGSRGNSLDGNPRQLSQADIAGLLEAML